MKKFITFSNFMVLLGIMTILFYLIPAVTFTPRGQNVSATLNLFAATFGGTVAVNIVGLDPHQLLASGGLITAFILGIIGIVLTFLKCKNRFATLLAFPLFVTSGILVACTATLTEKCIDNSTMFDTSLAGGAITVGTFWCILAFFALVDFIATVAKPKQPQNPAY